jgi:hypothetical protein
MSKQGMPPHGNRRYPWERWQDGRKHTVRHGKHFHIDPENFRRSVIVRARSRGLKAVTRVNGDAVTFQFVER